MAESKTRHRIILTGCGKTKQAGRTAARDMYTGTLCRMRREYAEMHLAATPDDADWFVLSAKFGLLDPATVIDPYDLTMKDLSRLHRVAWSLSVATSLVDHIEDDDASLRDISVEIHAGKEYAWHLQRVLHATGFSVSWPFEGMGIGEQQAQYKELAKRRQRPDSQWCWDSSTGVSI